MSPNVDFFAERRKPRRHEIRQRIQEEFAGTIIVRGGHGTKNKLHAPDGCGGSICGSFGDGDVGFEKSLAVMPPGHKDWCLRCLARLYPERTTIGGAP